MIETIQNLLDRGLLEVTHIDENGNFCYSLTPAGHEFRQNSESNVENKII